MGSQWQKGVSDVFADGITLTGGSIVTVGVPLSLVPDTGYPTIVGDISGALHGLDTNDDLSVGGRLAVGGVSYLDGAIVAGANIQLQVNGSGSAVLEQMRIGGVNAYGGAIVLYPDDGLHWSLNSQDMKQNHNLIFTSYANRSKNHGRNSLSTDPTAWWFSATDVDSDDTEWLSVSYGEIATGKGDLFLNPVGVLKFGVFTGSADAPINGYISAKDAAGNPIKLATIA